MSHALFGNADDSLVIIVERDPFHRSGEFPNVQGLAVRDVPET